MLRLCFRRRRLTVVITLLSFFIVSSLVVITSRNAVQVHVNDYDVAYDTDDDLHKVKVTNKVTIKVEEKVSDNIHTSLLTDRKPQGQEDYNPDEPGLYHRRVIFNKQNLPVIAKRLAFVQQHQYNNNNNLPQDDDDYANNYDVRSTGDTGLDDENDDVTEEDDEEDEYEYWENPNPVFKPEDFDNVQNFTKPPFLFQDVVKKKNTTKTIKILEHKQRTSQRTLNTSVPGSRVLHSKAPNAAKNSQLKFSASNSSQRKIENNGLYKSDKTMYEPPATQIQMPVLLKQAGKVQSNHGYPVIKDHIYWADEVEAFVPKGMDYNMMSETMENIRSSKVRTMQDPEWNRCGRPKNQYIVLENGRPLCARYRDPHNKLIYGELLSFYLSRMLGFDNIPIVVLSEVNSSAIQWQGQELKKAHWDEGTVVALMEWIDGLDEERSRVKMPSVILAAYEQGHTVTGQHPALPRMSKSELADLLQWGDMIILDYITGHYDRVASMQDGADREKKPSILSENIRNLRKVPNSGKLWLIDNESGLLDAYELMYKDINMGQRFLTFHSRMLQTMCVFRKSLIRKIKALAGHANPASVLLHYTKEYEPIYERLPKVSALHLFEMHFHSRLKEVTKWVTECIER